jgi:hypothetical protein
MLCAEKERLVEEYHRAAVVYSQAIITLNRQRAQSSQSEYDRLRRAADDASTKCKEARHALANHMAEHGCGQPEALKES